METGIVKVLNDIPIIKQNSFFKFGPTIRHGGFSSTEFSWLPAFAGQVVLRTL